jgi:hypothetical protein
MKRARVAAVVVGAAVAAMASVAGLAGAKDPMLKEMMGANVAGVQTILVSLISSNYAAVPDQVKLLEDHATWLTENVPESARGDRDRFVTYAYNLRGHAIDLRTIVEQLIEHDKASATTGQLATDGLREAAAAHYGGMVTMCVSCHNRFRTQIVR